MAKQPKTETNTSKVPDAELVGDHAKFNAAQGGDDATADTVGASAAGEKVPAAANSTDTTASGSGDAAGEVTTDLVKPQEGTEQTTAIPAEADQGATNPEVEASASGTSSTDNTSQGATAGGAGDTASATEGGVYPATGDQAISSVLGFEASGADRRRFIVFGPIRHNNVRYPKNSWITLTKTEHVELHDKNIVGSWDDEQAVSND